MFKTKLMLLATVATGVLMQPASALEAQAFVDRVAEVYKTIGYELDFGPATLDGDTITVDGVTVGIAGMSPAEGEPAAEPMVMDTEITFSGVTELPDGGYQAKSVTVPDIDTDFAADPVGHVTLSDIVLDGFYVPGGETVPAVGVIQLWQAFSTGPLSVSRDGKEVFTYDSVKAAYDFLPEQGSANLESVSGTLAVNGMSLDLTSLQEDDPTAAATIEALGLTTVTGNITQDLSWSMADGHMVVDKFLFDFDDVGALDINLDLTGLTPAVLDQIYAMQAQMAVPAGETPTEEQAQAQMMQGMAIMQGVSIVSAKVRYDDASLAGKLLDMFAKQAGVDRAAYVEGLKSTLPALIAQSGIPALNDVVVPPVSAFLDDPKSLEIKIAPPSPTSILVLAAAAANPAGLISALGLLVEANQAAQ